MEEEQNRKQSCKNSEAIGPVSSENFNNFHDQYSEELSINPLSDGKLFTQFKFKTTYRKDIKSLRWENKLELFPLSIADLVSLADLEELHFSLTKGNWDYRNWAYSTRPSPPGAQIRARLSKYNEDPNRSWNRLVNALAGKFCASLVSANQKTLVPTKLAFNQDKKFLYTNLPEETLCTENLTPWKKLLPCYSNAGLASLLNAVNLLKSSYSSLAIDIEPSSCHMTAQDKCACEKVQLTQTMIVVFNPLNLFEGRQTWSLAKIFGNSIVKGCQVASQSLIHVDITKLDDLDKLYPKTYSTHSIITKNGRNPESKKYATFDLNVLLANSTSIDKSHFNLGVKQNQLFKRLPATSRQHIPVFLKTHVAGQGADDGTIVASIDNLMDKPIHINYMDSVPHFLPVYLHTLTIRTKSGQELKPHKLNFVQSKQNSPTLIEFSLILPPESEVQISYDFERGFLHYSEYKPDANKGILISSAMIDMSIPSGREYLVFPDLQTNTSSENCEMDSERNMFKVYSRPLLIILATPDFSMPYNVICLVCTVLVSAIGPIYNLTTSKIDIDKKLLEKRSEKVESKKDK